MLLLMMQRHEPPPLLPISLFLLAILPPCLHSPSRLSRRHCSHHLHLHRRYMFARFTSLLHLLTSHYRLHACPLFIAFYDYAAVRCLFSTEACFCFSYIYVVLLTALFTPAAMPLPADMCSERLRAASSPTPAVFSAGWYYRITAEMARQDSQAASRVGRVEAARRHKLDCRSGCADCRRAQKAGRRCNKGQPPPQVRTAH